MNEMRRNFFTCDEKAKIRKYEKKFERNEKAEIRIQQGIRVLNWTRKQK